MTDAVATAAPAAPTMTPFRRALIMAPVLISTTLFVLNQTNIVVALPHMQGTFSATTDQIAWVITSYIVAMTIMTASAGWLSNRFGRKTVFVWSVAGFGVASLLCANAPTLEMEVLFRLLQGFAGGPILPVTQAIMLDAYPKEKAGTALGIWGVGITIGPVLGPILGGYITDEYSWPWVFYFNVPFAAALVAGIVLFVPATQKGQPRPFDWLGFAALSIALTAFQVVLARGELHDWFASTEIIVETAIALLALYALVVHTATARNPFLDPRIFMDRNVVLGLIFIFCWALTVNSPLVLLSLRLQTIDGMPVSLVGLLMSPRGLGGILTMSLIGRILTRVNPKYVVVFGFCMIAFASWIMSLWPPHASTWEVSLAGFILGVGVASAYVSLTVIAFSTIATTLRAEAVSFYSLILNMGSGVGIAVAIIVVSQGMQANHEILSHNITVFNALLRENALPHFWNYNLRRGLAAVDREVGLQAAVIAFNFAFHIISVMALAIIPFVAFLRRAKAKAK